jgi:hypothetical protein
MSVIVGYTVLVDREPAGRHQMTSTVEMEARALFPGDEIEWDGMPSTVWRVIPERDDKITLVISPLYSPSSRNLRVDGGMMITRIW